ncbi:hypothetical protein N7448_008630 [Penicillium atrosanguineum]|uniref:Uncharacterized protein n=1 Tax=Penicillium atrosanguineum TaxID=1132637 RepID=A0A9W9QBJ2_9EURO|nr:hypothetical protein N7448_008630 [Penicillium atrosanguineum]KAJ5148058.1 hypothetical protein N7526_001410 [Penicillium atrosanguineum]KAJ5330646.1 hypothetical protein N7476_000429 [Penicillium atrosanguineum]
MGGFMTLESTESARGDAYRRFVHTLDGSGTSQSDPWDFAHLNSIMRIYAIDKNGKLKWTLVGPTRGDFKLALGTTFCFQHDVRIVESMNSTVTLHIHNNNNAPFSEGTHATVGLLLKLDFVAKTASPERLFSDAEEVVYA